MDDTTATLRRLAETPEDDLYLEIGRHLYGRPAFPMPPEQLIELAKRWSQETLAKAVCGSDKLKIIASQDMSTQERIMAVCAALDVFSHVLGTVPVITAAALIVRAGLHKFCASIWSAEETGNAGAEQS